MKIWTLTTNDDDGINTDVYSTEDAANHAAAAWVESYTAHEVTDWRAEAERLYQRLGFMDSISLQVHVLPPDPALVLADEMCRVALPKFNWGASALTAEAIDLLNRAPIAIRKALL